MRETADEEFPPIRRWSGRPQIRLQMFGVGYVLIVLVLSMALWPYPGVPPAAIFLLHPVWGRVSSLRFIAAARTKGWKISYWNGFKIFPYEKPQHLMRRADYCSLPNVELSATELELAIYSITLSQWLQEPPRKLAIFW